jgi:hypothetical protein
VQTVEAVESNGDPALGGLPTPIALGDTFTGDLSSSTDSDWYTFTLTGRAIVQAAVYDDGGVPQLDSTKIQLYRETMPGTGTYAAYGTSSTLATSHRALNLNHPETLPAGNYAFEITVGSALPGTAPLNYNLVGKYGVRTLLLAMPGTNTVSESVEPNTSPATAAYLNLGDYAIGNCSGQNEGDWYGFVVNGPTTVAAMADNWGPTAITDTTVRLYDGNGTLITSQSSGGPAGTSHGRLIFTVPQAGIYFFEVSGGLFAATGDYILYTAGANPMFAAAGWNIQPPSTNACLGSNGLRPALGVNSSEAPMIGSTFVVRLINALPNAVVVPFFGFSNTVGNGGTTPLPFDLGPLGAPSCFVRVDPASSMIAVADGAGVLYLDFRIPAMTGLRGLPYFMQALLFDATNNALGVSVTNDARMLLGDRGF